MTDQPMSEDWQTKRHEPCLSYIGSGEYAPDMCEDPDGEWVYFKYHLARVAELEAQLQAKSDNPGNAPIPASSEWRPIETFPKIEGCYLVWDNGSPFMADYVDGTWWIYSTVAFTLSPTHWMPMPEAPNE